MHLGYNGSKKMALFPPLLLDPISADLLVSCDPRDGNDLLAHYRPLHHCNMTSRPCLLQRSVSAPRWRVWATHSGRGRPLTARGNFP